MQRRFFEHIYCEVCVAVDRRISRYDLWLLMWEGGGDRDELTREQVAYFIENNLSALLAKESCRLLPRARKRLEKRILHFDSRHPTPEEWLGSIFERTEEVA